MSIKGCAYVAVDDIGTCDSAHCSRIRMPLSVNVLLTSWDVSETGERSRRCCGRYTIPIGLCRGQPSGPWVNLAMREQLRP